MFLREGRQKGEVMKRHLDEGGWCQWDVSWCTDVAQKASIEREFYCTSRPRQELLLSQKMGILFLFRDANSLRLSVQKVAGCRRAHSQWRLGKYPMQSEET